MNLSKEDKMTKIRKIMLYGLFLSLLAAIFWTVYYLKRGFVPTGMFDFYLFKLKISRWWDIPLVLLIAPYCAWLSYLDSQEKKGMDVKPRAYPFIIVPFCSIFVGGVYGFANGIIYGAIAFPILWVFFNLDLIVSILMAIIDSSIWKKDIPKKY